jgi:hypothetical protein
MSTANINPIRQLFVSPGTSTLPMASSADWLDYSIRKFLTAAAIVCLRGVSDGMIGVECLHKDFNSYIQV